MNYLLININLHKEKGKNKKIKSAIEKFSFLGDNMPIQIDSSPD